MIRGDCQLGRKVVPHDSKSDLPLPPCIMTKISWKSKKKNRKTNLPNVFFYVHWAVVWFYKWMSTLGMDMVFHLHDPFDAVLVATWFGILFGILHTVQGILHCGFLSVDVRYAFLWSLFHTVSIETLYQEYAP